MSLFHALLLLVVIARGLELIHAARNTRRLLADGFSNDSASVMIAEAIRCAARWTTHE